MFCSNTYGAFGKIGHETSLNKYYWIEIIQRIFSDYSGIKLAFNNKNVTWKAAIAWKLMYF